MTIQNFSMTSGTSKTIQATVDNLQWGNITLLIKKNDTVVLSKTDIPTTANTLTITLDPADTQGLQGDYDYEITLTDDWGNVTNLFEGTISFRKSDGVIAQQVFIAAMNLMDAITQDGTFTGYPDDYKRKAWSILTMLQSELTPASVTPSSITDENSIFYVDDRTALMILPYGLAAHLLLTEDMNRASFFNNRYDELKRKRSAQIVPITDVLGVAGYAPPRIDNTPVILSNNDGGEW